MVFVEDIETALKRGVIPDLEQAFRTLVGYPGEDAIDGAQDADHLFSLLMQVAEALAHDESVMPRAAVDAIATVLSDADWLYNNAYSSGAAVVAEFGERWLALFHRHM
jgi:hypothetical protein